ncbi:MAG: secretin N-terminal domain-containing protein [Phycisphaeraceae bacterium]
MLAVSVSPGQAQSASPSGEDPEAPAAAAEPGRITLNFPPKSPLTSLIGYVSTRLDLNIIYDDSQVDERITLRTPASIPEDGLLDLLRSVLRSRNLLLQETGVERTLRIVPADQLATTTRMEQDGLGSAVTKTFELEHARPDRVLGVISPFLSKPGGNATVLAEEQIIIVSDHADVIRRVGDLVALVDVPQKMPVIRAVTLEHSQAEQLLDIVQPILQARAAAIGDARAEKSVAVTGDSRSNQIIVIGEAGMVDDAVRLIDSLDLDRALVRRVYRPKIVPPERLDEIIQQVLGDLATEHRYLAAADRDAGALVVTAPRGVHSQIDSLLADLDVPPPATQSPVRFYKLTNTVAADVLATIQALEGAEGFAGLTQGGEEGEQEASAGGEAPTSLFDAATEVQEREASGQDEAGAGVARAGGDGEDESVLSRSSLVLGGEDTPPRAMVAADENANSIIVIGSPAQQRIYAQLIERLDQRRPQVLIEATIVSLDTTDDYTLGVDVAAAEDVDDGRIISFSAFGVSELDPDTGELSPLNAPGGTLALLSPDIADVVIRALARNRRSRVLSMPRVLVNDNQEAKLTSEREVPFEQSVVPEGDFLFSSAEYATAGTTITIEPHISEDDYLQLYYLITLSDFTAPPSGNLPPPRQTNTIDSHVTIPDDHTIVVGGLRTGDLTEVVSKVPLLGDLPLAGALFRSTDQSVSERTLFIFIRPTILRDERFGDLKYISGLGRREADIDGDLPASEPMLIVPSAPESSAEPEEAEVLP